MVLLCIKENPEAPTAFFIAGSFRRLDQSSAAFCVCFVAAAHRAVEVHQTACGPREIRMIASSVRMPRTPLMPVSTYQVLILTEAKSSSDTSVEDSVKR